MPRKRDPERPGQILEVALRLFGERGYHDTQIADIAAELGIGHGTVYRYFENKRALFETLLDDTFTRFAVALQSASPMAAETLDDYVGQLRLIGDTLNATFAENPARLRLVLQAETLDEAMHERIQMAMTAFVHVSTVRLANGVLRGFLRSDLDVQATAELMLALTMEGVRRSVAEADRGGDIDRYLDAALALITRGIAA
jgi:AcrR family transcriptional regulator